MDRRSVTRRRRRRRQTPIVAGAPEGPALGCHVMGSPC